jgi:hypothetical protein
MSNREDGMTGGLSETFFPRRAIEARLRNLEAHLEQENPILLDAVQSFRELDRVGYRMGLLSRDESFATQVPWWPLISILGTFSSGKSTFINDYLGTKLQLTGNQAVDDKFTVICFSREQEHRTLPGLALDADPRFPFYKISHEIDKVAEGEGSRVNAYLQLKTTPSESMRGKIFIDSPGFDADAQRTSTLRITDHIIDLSDLVVVMFDARHPEPGAMQDTLQHLVSGTIARADSSKFLYVLNQIDTASKEDNPEEVFGAWQRALSQAGLTAGRFFAIYSDQAAVTIDDESLRRRFEAKRDQDRRAIYERIHQIEIERAYRIIGALEKTAVEIEKSAAPTLGNAVSRWRRGVLWTDGIVFGLILIGLLAVSIWQGWWDGLRFAPGWLQVFEGRPWLAILSAVIAGLAVLGVHFQIRGLVAGRVSRHLHNEGIPGDIHNAFRKNTRFWRSIFRPQAVGWARRSRRRVRKVLADTGIFVQRLNDRFTNPSGRGEEQPRKGPEGIDELLALGAARSGPTPAEEREGDRAGEAAPDRREERGREGA